MLVNVTTAALQTTKHANRRYSKGTWYTQAHEAPRWKPQMTARPAVSGANTRTEVGTVTRVPPRQGSSTKCCNETVELKLMSSLFPSRCAWATIQTYQITSGQNV
jgi:hypothetical protein